MASGHYEAIPTVVGETITGRPGQYNTQVAFIRYRLKPNATPATTYRVVYVVERRRSQICTWTSDGVGKS